jgi:WD40 repeat protein
MDPSLKPLLDRLDSLSEEFRELSEGVRRAILVAEVDPEMALTRARKVLEYVVRDVYERRVKEPPGTRPLENLLQRLVKDKFLPGRLDAYANAIRQLGNVGTHNFGEKITVADVNQSLGQLTFILEWYFEHERPVPAAEQATAAPAASAAGDGAVAAASPRPGEKPAPRGWRPVAAGVGVAAILLGLVTLWAAGVFRGKTADDSVLVVEVNEPNPDVFVDGEKVAVTWGDGGKRAEVRAKSGTHKVEVKKDGFTAYGEEVEFEHAKRRVLTARLVSQAPPIQPKEGGEQPPPASGNGSAGEYDPTGGYRFAHFGPGGPRIVLCYASSEMKEYFARVYDLSTGEALTPPLKHDSKVSDASFSPDGKRVVTAGGDKTARVWDATTGKEYTPSLKHDASVVYASFSPDGKQVVTASIDKTARVWDATTGQALSAPLKHEGYVSHAAFSPDGKRVVTASWDNTARVWDAATGEALTPPLKHDGWVGYASFSPDGKRVLTASRDQTARMWDATTGQALTAPLKHEGTVCHAAFSPDGRRVVTASTDQTARVWDAATGEALIPPLKHESSVWYAAFSPDGKRVVTADGDYTARVWDAATGKELTPPLKHYQQLRYAAFSPDGKRVVTASWSGTARLWDTETGMELKAVTITPD